jgi:hypothetical protein
MKEALREKPKLQWGIYEVGDASKVKYLPKKAAGSKRS